jgi:hypothetical protein
VLGLGYISPGGEESLAAGECRTPDILYGPSVSLRQCAEEFARTPEYARLHDAAARCGAQLVWISRARSDVHKAVARSVSRQHKASFSGKI